MEVERDGRERRERRPSIPHLIAGVMKRIVGRKGAFKYQFTVRVQHAALRDRATLSNDVRYRLLWKKGHRAALRTV